jgi:hypothetical protein
VPCLPSAVVNPRGCEGARERDGVVPVGFNELLGSFSCGRRAPVPLPERTKLMSMMTAIERQHRDAGRSAAGASTAAGGGRDYTCASAAATMPTASASRCCTVAAGTRTTR